MDYVKANSEKNPDLSKYLKEDIATEAVVTLQNLIVISCVSYCSKKGTSGENLKENVIKEVMQLQCCKACLESSKDTIVCSQCCESSLCETCLNLEAVCDKCKEEGQLSYCPSLRACKRCLENHIQCVKFLVLAWSIDCESGNRKMADLVAEENIQFLEYLVVFPDVVHLAKTYKCSWSNWFLILGEGDRSTLSTLRMLRNESSPEITGVLQNLLTAKSVRNKDRMATDPLTMLTDPKLLTYLDSIKEMFLTISILPDRYRVSDTNKRGMYEHPYALCSASNRNIIFLNWNSLTRSSDLSQVRLHSPADSKIVHRNVQSKGLSLCYLNGSALFCGEKGILYVDIEGKFTLYLSCMKSISILHYYL